MIALRSATIRAGSFALRDVSFAVPEGGYAVLMGRTGVGKTTLLEAICGLRSVESGTVHVSNIDVSAHSPSERGIGYVPQDRALFPTMTVRDQLGFALSIRRRSAQEVGERVRELARWLDLVPLLDRKPRGLSGGEAQRVALGRALSHRPGVLLLDEPLSALDGETHASLLGMLKDLHAQTGVTMLHVTHNPVEANALATVTLHLHEGRIEQREFRDGTDDNSH